MKKKTPAEELLDSLLNEVGEGASTGIEGIVNLDPEEVTFNTLETRNFEDEQIEGILPVDPNAKTEIRSSNLKTEIWSPNAKTEIRGRALLKEHVEKTEIRQDTFASEEASGYESTRIGSPPTLDGENTEFGALELEISHDESAPMEEFIMPAPEPVDQPVPVVAVAVEKLKPTAVPLPEPPSLFSSPPQVVPIGEFKTQVMSSVAAAPSNDTFLLNDKTQAIASSTAVLAVAPKYDDGKSSVKAKTDNERTLAVTGFHIKPDESIEGKVKVSVGQQGRTTGFASWGGGIESNLSQAENLRMAQEKILALENENEKTRRQNEELIAATEILKERSDLMTAQLTEYKGDRDNLEQSFKNELTLLKNHLVRKDTELKKAQFKVDELESRLKFDLKKIRVRERELENRLELVRAEKNAISKNKDEQILDLRRKMDVMQMEVDSYRQKCVDLNKQIENSQDSFKRTTRALRLAMANLELQEENKVPLKKAE